MALATRQTKPQAHLHGFQESTISGPSIGRAHQPHQHAPTAGGHGQLRRDLPLASFPSHSHVLSTPGPHASQAVELYGNYRIYGPASIRKVGAGALLANLAPHGQIDALEGGNCDTLSCETLECDEDQPCSLVAEHVELHGNFLLVKDSGPVSPVAVQGMHVLGDKFVLTVSLLPDDTRIVLEAGGQLNHPVTVRH